MSQYGWCGVGLDAIDEGTLTGHSVNTGESWDHGRGATKGDEDGNLDYGRETLLRELVRRFSVDQAIVRDDGLSCPDGPDLETMNAWG